MRNETIQPLRSKSALLIVASAVLITQLSVPVLAQTPSLTVPTSSITVTPTLPPTETPTPTPTLPPETYLEVVADVGTQYPWNKRIPLKILITPKVTGQQLEIRWQSKASVTGEPVTTIIQNPQANKTYTVKFLLTPRAAGYQRAVADIILTTNNTNFVSSTNVPLQFDANRVVVPTTATYIFYSIAMYISLAIFFLAALPFMLYQVYLYLKNVLIPKWLEARIKKPL